MARSEERRILGCRSDADVAELGAITVLGESKFAGELRADASAETKRRELIASVRAGTHHELLVEATTFRQKEGVANRRNIRHADGALEALAGSFVGMPVLLDHDTRSQASRIGTIVESSLARHGGTGWANLNQKLRIVKPEAVISVLDGTIDRFSIGWLPTGPVLCSVHGVDVRGADSCYCWPGDQVSIEGKLRTVEYVFTAADGIEVSAVNVPAVKGTKVDDIRSALAAELDFSPRSPEPAGHMRFTLLAAALSMTALTEADEAAALRAVEDLKRGKLTAEQERDEARRQLKELETKLTATEARVAVAEASALDSEIAAAIKDGKLRMTRDAEGKPVPSKLELRARAIGTEKGLAAMREFLGELDAVIPIGQRPAAERDPVERTPTLAAGDDADLEALDAELKIVAEKTGQSLDALRKEALRIRNRNKGR